jgi:hypothetical protein
MSVVNAPIFENLKKNQNLDVNLLLKRHKDKLSRNKLILVSTLGKTERAENPYENLLIAPSGKKTV